MSVTSPHFMHHTQVQGYSRALTASGGPSPEAGDESLPEAADHFTKSSSFEQRELRKKIESYSAGTVPTAPSGEPIQTRQYSDNHGRIEHLLLMLSSSYQGDSRRQILSAYRTLFERMEPDTRFTICYQSEQDRNDIMSAVRDSISANPERVNLVQVPCNNGGEMTIWARDIIVSSFDEDNPDTTMMIDARHIHVTDGNVAHVIAGSEPATRVLPAYAMTIEGGNTVSNGHDSFIGYGSLMQTSRDIRGFVYNFPDLEPWLVRYYNSTIIDGAGKLPDSFITHMKAYPAGSHITKLGMPEYEVLAHRLFEEYFGKEVVVLGKDDPATPDIIERPAAFHTDMMITPLDDESFTIGDPVLFEKMAAAMSPGEKEKAEQQLREISGIDYSFERFINDSAGENIPANFSHYEKTLKDRGYKDENIIPMPYRFAGYPGLPNFTYNNCLIEDFEKDGARVKRVFLPIIGVDYFDHYAVKTYEEKGYQVISLPMGHVSKLMGELRCVTNWLERSEKA